MRSLWAPRVGNRCRGALGTGLTVLLGTGLLVIASLSGCRDQVVSLSDDELKCEETGGSWLVDACGHTRCGESVTCVRAEPGCHCGPFRRFVTGVGCVHDATCEHHCGGLAALACPAGSICVDAAGDGCGATCGADCLGICVERPADPCGGIAGLPCPIGFECVDDPADTCSSDCGDLDCSGLCRSTVGLCGGIAGFPCPPAYRCVDDPSDDCTPETGGADCSGLCVPEP